MHNFLVSPVTGSASQEDRIGEGEREGEVHTPASETRGPQGMPAQWQALICKATPSLTLVVRLCWLSGCMDQGGKKGRSDEDTK